MCDESCARAGVGGARRSYRHSSSSWESRSRFRSNSVTTLSPARGRGHSGSRNRRRVRRVTSSTPVAGAGGDRSVHQALCGGIVAGVLFGGVLGGIIGGAAAASAASLVAKRNQRRQAAAAAAAVSTSSDPPSLSDNASSMTMTTEEAMVATGRAIASAERGLSMTSSGVSATCRAGTGDVIGDGGDGFTGGVPSSGEDLPAAQVVAKPVHHAVAVPCTSRSIRTAGNLTAVTATPDNDVLVGVPMLSVSRRGVTAASPGPRGSCGRCGGSCGMTRDDRMELHDGESEEGEGGGDEWWAGEEFEEEWACIFEAYCPEGQGRRLPCLTAREPLQGSGVTGRVARGILRIADWDGSGDLGRDEFALAMYLCRRYRLGEGVPSMLETWMIPPGLREARGCEDDGPSPAFPPRG